jgi:hypothetical protein
VGRLNRLLLVPTLTAVACVAMLTACSSSAPATTPSSSRSSQTPTPDGASTSASPSPGSPIKHIFVVILENESGSAAARDPYLGQLAARGATLTRYFGVAHPSQPNYIAMLAGATLVGDDGSHNLSQSNLVDLLESANHSWKAYQEQYPGGCFSGGNAGDSKSGTYARKHNPFISFDDVRKVPGRCGKIVNASQLDADVDQGQLPEFSFYTPNQNNDGHDTSLGFASSWLRGFLEPKLADPKFMDGTLVVVTFDEGSGDPMSDPLYAVLLGPMVARGSVDGNRYSHYSLLHTVENAFGIGSLGREDAKSQAFGACNFDGGCGP